MYQLNFTKSLTSKFLKIINQKYSFMYTITILISFFLLASKGFCITIPPYINYQGRLTESSNGSSVNDVLIMTVSIYSESDGGDAIYTQTKEVSVNNGLFKIDIGKDPGIYQGEPVEGDDGIPKEVFTENNKLYIGVKIGDSSEMWPRQKINSVAYAFKAEEAAYSIKAGEAENVRGQITVSDSGNVGIGTTEPAAKLHVVGASSFTEAMTVAGVYNPTTPRGGIIMYSGAWNFNGTGLGTGDLAGWALCNGNNGTPNLSDRFVMGTVTSPTPGTTGGANSYSLTTSQLPSHSHTISQDGAHTHTYSKTTWDVAAPTAGIAYPVVGYNLRLLYDSAATSSAGAHNHGGGTGNTGSGASIDNRPSFIQLAFIMKL